MSSSAPWHRVVSTSGIIAEHGDLGAAQRRALEREGVSLTPGLLGETRVDFSKYGWFPERSELVPQTRPDDDWAA